PCAFGCSIGPQVLEQPEDPFFWSVEGVSSSASAHCTDACIVVLLWENVAAELKIGGLVHRLCVGKISGDTELIAEEQVVLGNVDLMWIGFLLVPHKIFQLPRRKKGPSQK